MAGWQMVIGGFFDLIGLVGATIVAKMLSRKGTLILSLMSCAIAVWCFGFAGAVHGRGWILEAAYQFGVFGFYWVPSMMFVVLYQFALDAYDTSVASTGSGVCQASGRIGAIIGPQVFEYIKKWTGRWQYFCYVVAVACILASLFVQCMDSGEQKDTAKLDEPFEVNNEEEPLLKNRRAFAEA